MCEKENSCHGEKPYEGLTEVLMEDDFGKPLPFGVSEKVNKFVQNILEGNKPADELREQAIELCAECHTGDCPKCKGCHS